MHLPTKLPASLRGSVFFTALFLIFSFTVPLQADAGHVREYTRADGIHVSGYERSDRSREKPSKKSSVHCKKSRASHPSRVKRDSRGKIKRSSKAKHDFMLETGHPNGWAGHEVDHVRPLKWGGKDSPDNMQWLTEKQHKTKSRMEGGK